MGHIVISRYVTRPTGIYARSVYIQRISCPLRHIHQRRRRAVGHRTQVCLHSKDILFAVRRPYVTTCHCTRARVVAVLREKDGGRVAVKGYPAYTTKRSVTRPWTVRLPALPPPTVLSAGKDVSPSELARARDCISCRINTIFLFPFCPVRHGAVVVPRVNRDVKCHRRVSRTGPTVRDGRGKTVSWCVFGPFEDFPTGFPHRAVLTRSTVKKRTPPIRPLSRGAYTTRTVLSANTFLSHASLHLHNTYMCIKIWHFSISRIILSPLQERKRTDHRYS